MARTVGARTRAYDRQPRARDRAWQSMRILRTFTLPDLMATAEIKRDNALRYVLGLERSGYLKRTRERRSGCKGGFAVWMLVRNAGPKAPRLQTDGTTYDPNTHQTYQGGIAQ